MIEEKSSKLAGWNMSVMRNIWSEINISKGELS
jgi:hypothetical protein